MVINGHHMVYAYNTTGQVPNGYIFREYISHGNAGFYTLRAINGLPGDSAVTPRLYRTRGTISVNGITAVGPSVLNNTGFDLEVVVALHEGYNDIEVSLTKEDAAAGFAFLAVALY